MEIYITCLLQILSFSSRFRRFEMKNFLQQPTMVAIIYIIISPPPHTQNFFHLHLYGEDFQNVILCRKFHHGLEAHLSCKLCNEICRWNHQQISIIFRDRLCSSNSTCFFLTFITFATLNSKLKEGALLKVKKTAAKTKYSKLMSKIIKFTQAFMMQTSHERKTRNKFLLQFNLIFFSINRIKKLFSDKTVTKMKPECLDFGSFKITCHSGNSDKGSVLFCLKDHKLPFAKERSEVCQNLIVFDVSLTKARQ